MPKAFKTNSECDAKRAELEKQGYAVPKPDVISVENTYALVAQIPRCMLLFNKVTRDMKLLSRDGRVCAVNPDKVVEALLNAGYRNPLKTEISTANLMTMLGPSPHDSALLINDAGRIKIVSKKTGYITDITPKKNDAPPQRISRRQKLKKLILK